MSSLCSTLRQHRIQLVESAGLIAVVRMERPEEVILAVDCLVQGGIRAIEITTTVPDWSELLRVLREKYPPSQPRAIRPGEHTDVAPANVVLGAGTVLTSDHAQKAVAMGAEFVVSPVGPVPWLEEVQSVHVACMIGARTPSECFRVHESGADWIKLFPAEDLGPKYLRALKAPMPFLRVIPTGGVTLDNLTAWRQAGCRAVGVGSALVPSRFSGGLDSGTLIEHSRHWQIRWSMAGG